jgi:hypothetical protein
VSYEGRIRQAGAEAPSAERQVPSSFSLNCEPQPPPGHSLTGFSKQQHWKAATWVHQLQVQRECILFIWTILCNWVIKKDGNSSKDNLCLWCGRRASPTAQELRGEYWMTRTTPHYWCCGRWWRSLCHPACRPCRQRYDKDEDNLCRTHRQVRPGTKESRSCSHSSSSRDQTRFTQPADSSSR